MQIQIQIYIELEIYGGRQKYRRFIDIEIEGDEDKNGNKERGREIEMIEIERRERDFEILASWKSRKNLIFLVQRLARGINSSFQKFRFFYIGSTTDWMRATNITGGNLLYSKSTELNVNHT